MISSIKKCLLFNLTISLTIIISLAVMSNSLIERKGFNAQLDTNLSLYAFNIESFLNNSLQTKNLADIQKAIDTITIKTLKESHNNKVKNNLALLLKSIHFQILNQKGELLLHSFSAPIKTNKTTNGFSHTWVNNHKWRTFTLNIPEQKLKITVLQRYDFRNAIEKTTINNSIAIMLTTYSILVLLIWIIVKKSLGRLNSIARSIKQSRPGQLKKINTTHIPSEIQPLVTELNNLFAQLSLALEREKRFSSDAAHELKTPIATLKTQLQVALLDQEISEKTQETFKKMLKQTNKSSHIISQLLALSNILPSTIKNSMKKTNLHKITKEAIINALPFADKKNISLSLDYQTKSNFIFSYETAIIILLRNLLDNAIRYCPKGCEVSINISNIAKKTIIKITDNGPGISDNLKDRVFERFFRITDTKTEGSGLGLSIVKQIVNLHKASINLSKPKDHSGLEVTITLPANINCSNK